MVHRQFARVLHYLHRVADKQSVQPGDGDLLRRFIEQRDESAFALLVERHGNMVLGVCRRVLHHVHDAEDVFQATFLVLARKASSIRKHQSLSSWLYGVAYRTALKLRGKPVVTVPLFEDLPGDEPAPDRCNLDLRPVLDEELSRLPDKYRDPVVLCYLEGKTNEEAARELGWTKGTVSGRLARARDLLRHRLVRRGLSLTPALLTGFLCEQTASAAVSAPLLLSTVQAAAGNVSGETPGRAAVLAEGVLKTMLLHKIKTAVGVVLVLAILAGATSLIPPVFQSPADSPAFAAGPLFASQPGQKEATDQDLLQGTWRVTKFLAPDKDVGDIALQQLALSMRFDGNDLTIIKGDKEAKGRYTIDTKTNPKQINLTIFDQTLGTGLGIYQLDGDELRLCLAEDKIGRPTSFDPKVHPTAVAVWLQRVQPKKLGKAGPTTPALDPNIQAEQDKVAVLQAQLASQLELVQQLQKERTALQEAWKGFVQKKISQQDLENLILGRDEIQRLKAENDQLREELKVMEARLAQLQNNADKALYLRELQAAYDQLRKAQAEAADQRERAEMERAKAEAERDKAVANQKVEEAKLTLKEKADRTRSSNNLKQIGLAFHNYHDVHGKFPANAIYNKTGQPLLSWRVAILPYLDQDALYKEFKQDEPWDSPHNIKLLDRIPMQFAPVGTTVKEKTATFYQVFTGPKTLFDGTNGLRFNDILDGTSNTVLVVEGGKAVPWSKPEDLPFVPGKLPKLGGMLRGGFNLLVADGSVRFIPDGFDPQVLEQLILPTDGGTGGVDKLIPRK